MNRTYGRGTIYANYTEKELLSGTVDDQLNKILEILPEVLDMHEENKRDSIYLWEYYLGKQDILYKEKHTRPDINNKKVENWAWAIVDFKKGWQLGKPIQYVMSESFASDELSELNKYMKYEGKESKDQDIYEDCLVVGRGFIYTNKNKINDDDEAPFEIINIDNDCCEVVYSSKLGNEQLFSMIETPMKKVIDDEEIFFNQYTIYTRNRMFVLDREDGEDGIKVIKVIDKRPIVLKEHLITEYFLNRDRISLIELGKDIFDGINQIESLDFDNMEQFINSIMVFINADVDQKTIQAMKDVGAVKIISSKNQTADVRLLAENLGSDQTQVFYTRLLVGLHQILGVPMSTDSGSVTSGDTGQAKLTGQGYTSAGIRAHTDETKFKACDYILLKKILKICRISNDSAVKTLKAKDIDIKLQRDMSDNLLVKTQGLMNLLASDIPREYAIPIINLFSDSNAVIKSMESKFGEQQSSSSMKMKTQEIEEQNNEMKNIENKENQKQ